MIDATILVFDDCDIGIGATIINNFLDVKNNFLAVKNDLLEAEKKRLKFNVFNKIRQMLPKFILNIIRFLRSPKYNP